MKEKLVGNRGFSTLEIVIALAISAFIIVGALDASVGTAYWALASETASEGLSVAKQTLEELRATSELDFQSATSSSWLKHDDTSKAYTASCRNGSLCYFSRKIVSDVSSCSKLARAEVSWQVGASYATTTTSLETLFVDHNDITARGGDCAVREFLASWNTNTPSTLADFERTGSIFQTGIDVLGDFAYVSASSSPQLSIFNIEGNALGLIGEWGGETGSVRLNALDAISDRENNKRYVFAAQHSSTSQLAVFDVTDNTNPVLVTTRGLLDVLNTSSYPEGWRLLVYGNRLYITTRETAGPELHVFDITNPENPTEISTAKRELNRTVNELFVREQFINGTLRRLLFLVADSNLKEVAILDVMNDAPIERVVANLPGNTDALTLSLLGNTLLVGRARTTGGPELYQFDVLELFNSISAPQKTGETDATIHTLLGSGKYLFLGTNKTGAEFSVWNSDSSTWNPNISNSGRISSLPFSNLAPLGFDFANGNIVGISQSSSDIESLRFVTAQP